MSSYLWHLKNKVWHLRETYDLKLLHGILKEVGLCKIHSNKLLQHRDKERNHLNLLAISYQASSARQYNQMELSI